MLWAVANVGMIGGAFGLLALDVARPRWLAVLGAAINILGNLIRIVASALIIAGVGADVYTPVVLSSMPLMMFGMGALGAATLLGLALLLVTVVAGVAAILSGERQAAEGYAPRWLRAS